MQQTRLSDVKSSPNLRIVRVEEQMNQHIVRLCELGFVPGARLAILRQTKPSAPMIVTINNAQICVERSLAQCFWVES